MSELEPLSSLPGMPEKREYGPKPPASATHRGTVVSYGTHDETRVEEHNHSYHRSEALAQKHVARNEAFLKKASKGRMKTRGYVSARNEAGEFPPEKT